MSKAIIRIATPLGISGHDHILVGKNGHASLKGMRLISPTGAPKNQMLATRGCASIMRRTSRAARCRAEGPAVKRRMGFRIGGPS